MLCYTCTTCWELSRQADPTMGQRSTESQWSHRKKPSSPVPSYLQDKFLGPAKWQCWWSFSLLVYLVKLACLTLQLWSSENQSQLGRQTTARVCLGGSLESLSLWVPLLMSAWQTKECWIFLGLFARLVSHRNSRSQQSYELERMRTTCRQYTRLSRHGSHIPHPEQVILRHMVLKWDQYFCHYSRIFHSSERVCFDPCSSTEWMLE